MCRWACPKARNGIASRDLKSRRRRSRRIWRQCRSPSPTSGVTTRRRYRFRTVCSCRRPAAPRRKRPSAASSGSLDAGTRNSRRGLSPRRRMSRYPPTSVAGSTSGRSTGTRPAPTCFTTRVLCRHNAGRCHPRVSTSNWELPRTTCSCCWRQRVCRIRCSMPGSFRSGPCTTRSLHAGWTHSITRPTRMRVSFWLPRPPGFRLRPRAARINPSARRWSGSDSPASPRSSPGTWTSWR